MKRALLVPLLYVILAAPQALGQGCILCWSSANNADDAGKSAINRAVTVLLVPSLGLMAGLFGLVVVYTRRQEASEEAARREESDSQGPQS